MSRTEEIAKTVERVAKEQKIYRTQTIADLCAAAAKLRELERALTESVKLQSHYAELLNMHDGGKRLTFTVDEWLARLADVKPVQKR